jgi:guanine deaminase
MTSLGASTIAPTSMRSSGLRGLRPAGAGGLRDDGPIVDNFPYAEEEFSAAQLAELRALRPPPEGELLGLVRELAAKHHPASSRVGLLVSVSAPQRATKEFLLAARRLADELDLPLVSHVHETRMQVVTGQLFFGKPQVEYLSDIGFLKPKTSLIHAVWLNPREIAALAETRHRAAQPWSNLMLGSAISRWPPRRRRQRQASAPTAPARPRPRAC